jgi:hypothetical protein
MATTHHEGHTARLATSEMWGAVAIASMWLAVLFTSVYGHDMVSVNGGGTNSTTIPSGLVVAFLACLATVSVAKRAFRRESGPNAP